MYGKDNIFTFVYFHVKIKIFKILVPQKILDCIQEFFYMFLHLFKFLQTIIQTYLTA